MRSIRIALLRMRSLLRRSRAEAELDRELDLHIEQLTLQYVADGLSEREARLMARREFGPVGLLKEQCRDKRRVRLLEDLAKDLGYAFRQLRKEPGFTLTVGLTLALGLGATTAIFSLLNAVLLRPLPVADPGSLVQFTNSIALWETGNSNGKSLYSYLQFDRFRAQPGVLAGVFAESTIGRVNVSYAGNAGTAQAEAYSGGFFAVLGLVPQRGRFFTPDDDQPGASAVVLSDRYWRTRFGADPSLVGAAIRINQSAFTVVGITPPEYLGITPGYYPDVCVPLYALDRLQPDSKRWTDPLATGLLVAGRLRPDVSRELAQVELDAVSRRVLAERVPDSPMASWANVRRVVRDGRLLLRGASTGVDGGLRDRYAYPLKLLLGVAGLVLLVACANIANLLLARVSNRRREIAIRLALGASRGRLIRQHLTESILLALLGGVLALPLAWWGSGGLVSMISTGDARLALAVDPDGRVFAFAFGVCLVTGLLFGLAPALRSTREHPGEALKHAATRASGGPRTLDRVLVVAQISLSVVLVTGAGLFVRTLRELGKVDVGYDRSNVLMFSVDAAQAGYPSARASAVYGEILRRLRELPDVVAASASLVRPVDEQFFLVDRVDEVDGRRLEERAAIRAAWNAVSPGYFSTVSTPLLAGRDFDDRDHERAQSVAILSQSLATAAFPGRSALGRRVGNATVVGVVRDSRYRGAREEPRPILYLPLRQAGARRAFDWGYVSFELRYRTGAGLVEHARREVAAVDRNLPIFRARTLEAQAQQGLLKERLMATLSGYFGGLGLLLACVGLSGLMAYAVAGRTAEIGIRLALGAGGEQVTWLILRETAWLTGVGIALGIPVALSVAYLTGSLLFGISPADPLTLAITVLLLAAVGLVAGYLPARRALRLDPLRALRYE